MLVEGAAPEEPRSPRRPAPWRQLAAFADKPLSAKRWIRPPTSSGHPTDKEAKPSTKAAPVGKSLRKESPSLRPFCTWRRESFSAEHIRNSGFTIRGSALSLGGRGRFAIA